MAALLLMGVGLGGGVGGRLLVSGLPGVGGLPLVMRYGEGGGLIAAERARREALRLEAAGLFEQGCLSDAQIGCRFRVSRMSVNRGRAPGRPAGAAAQNAN